MADEEIQSIKKRVIDSQQDSPPKKPKKKTKEPEESPKKTKPTKVLFPCGIHLFSIGEAYSRRKFRHR